MLATSDPTDARDSLAYWEDRARRLPRYAFRARREAHHMAARWRARVADAERAAYGSGLLGSMLLLLTEGRLPERTRYVGRVAAHRGAQVLTIAAVTCAALAMLAVVAVVSLVASLF